MDFELVQEQHSFGQASMKVIAFSRHRVGLALAVALFAAMGSNAFAQTYPSKLVTILVGFPAGGPADGTARILSEELAKQWGQTVIVDNRPGANGTLAAGMLAKAPADGHTLVMGTRSLTMNAALYTKLPYDPAKSFIPVAVASEQANALVVAPAFPARDLPEVIELLKASPGKYTTLPRASAAFRICRVNCFSA
jgi:tripartite-type tricarboxylate transporter receptor subunit TctC